MTAFFVYGSLRPGEYNSIVFQHLARPSFDGDAAVQGFKLIDGGAFPYAVRAPGQFTAGCLWTPHNGDCEWELLRYLDQLEGVPVHYQRSIEQVLAGGGRYPAWMYSASPATVADLVNKGYPDVPDNDWLAHRSVR